MQDQLVQILEVRAGDNERALTITGAVTGDASRAIFTALSEQLDRRRRDALDGADDVLQLREETALAERFEPLAAGGTHAVLSLTDAELHACLLGLTAYANRMDGDHYQPPELRERLGVIAGVLAVLWDANAAAANIAEAAFSPPAPLI
ncbi:MAG: hypothetical protein WBQ18_02020 [Solirubrobacteraceae bacterium]